MKIAFDLDGVLCDIDVAMLFVIRFLGQETKKIETEYYKERKPLLNPHLFLTEKDEFIIVTSRKKHLYDITKRWVKKYFPGIKLFLINKDYTCPREIAKEKMRIIRRENVRVYFDDSAKIIEAMRALNKIEREYSIMTTKPEIMFIQYSGRID